MQNFTLFNKIVLAIAIISTSIAVYLFINIGPIMEPATTNVISNNTKNVTPEEVDSADDIVVSGNKNDIVTKTTKISEDPKDFFAEGEFTAYLTHIQDNDSGFYLSFDYVIFDLTTLPGPTLINNSKRIQIFPISPELMVGYDFTNSMNGNKFYKIRDYVKMLTLEGDNYRNLKIYDDSYQHGGLYTIVVKGGRVVKMYEVGDFTKSQGTE